MEKKTSNRNSSVLRHLLLRHKQPPDFPLEQQIKEFNVFFNKAQFAHLDLDERLESFAKGKNWTDDSRINFRIMSAIKDGWTLVFDETAKKHLKSLIAQKGGQGADWVYKYECRICGSVDKRGIKRFLSQPQYDRLTEDEALEKLLGEIKMCPNCGNYAQFKKVRARTQSWEVEKHLRKNKRIQERKSIKGIPLTLEQVRDFDKALDEFQKKVVNKGSELIFGRIPTEREIREFRLYAKPYIKRCYEPLGGRLCARPDCLNILPQGSRTSRKYCSMECKATQKSRRARRR